MCLPLFAYVAYIVILIDVWMCRVWVRIKRDPDAQSHLFANPILSTVPKFILEIAQISCMVSPEAWRLKVEVSLPLKLIYFNDYLTLPLINTSGCERNALAV